MIRQFTGDVLWTTATFSYAASSVSPSLSHSMSAVLWLHVYLDLGGIKNVLYLDALFPEHRAVQTRRQKRYSNQNFLITSHPSILEVSSTSLKGKSCSVLNRRYLLTPWCRVLLEQLTGLQLVKKFPAFHGTQRFITALTSVRHLSLYWASPIQSIYPHPTSWRTILLLSTHLRLGLPSGLFPSGFPTKTLYTPLSSPIRATLNRRFVTT